MRFVDILEDALMANLGDAPASREPWIRSAPARPVFHSPLYNLHTPAQGAGVANPRAIAYRAESANCLFGIAGGKVESEQRACLWSNRRPEDLRESPAPDYDATIGRGAPNVTKLDSHDVTPLRSTGRPARMTRRLTTAQSRSLEAINRLGADIGADFSASELRSAFRILARRYHPDRHPHASAADRQRLSLQFATIRISYDMLLTALDPPNA